MDIKWIHFPLHPETPVEGLPLEELFRGRDMEAAHRHLYQRMQEAGLAYGERTRTYNSRLAQELARWADTQEDGEAIHGALFEAYFVKDRNLADADVLLDIAKSAGLDEDMAGKVLQDRLFRPQVDEDWQFARSIGVTGVPTFLSNNQALVGCQPYEVLEDFVLHLQRQTAG